jgi:hypothetical protein
MIQEIRMAGYRRDILASLGNISGFTQLLTPMNSANHVGHNDDQITIIIADKAITYKLQPDSRGRPVGMAALGRVAHSWPKMLKTSI